MTHEQKIKYMDIAASLCKFGFKTEHLDMLVCIYELVVEKKGNADMMDVATIQAKVKERELQREKAEKKKK